MEAVSSGSGCYRNDAKPLRPIVTGGRVGSLVGGQVTTGGTLFFIH